MNFTFTHDSDYAAKGSFVCRLRIELTAWCKTERGGASFEIEQIYNEDTDEYISLAQLDEAERTQISEQAQRIADANANYLYQEYCEGMNADRDYV